MQNTRLATKIARRGRWPSRPPSSLHLRAALAHRLLVGSLEMTAEGKDIRSGAASAVAARRIPSRHHPRVARDFRKAKGDSRGWDRKALRPGSSGAARRRTLRRRALSIFYTFGDEDETTRAGVKSLPRAAEPNGAVAERSEVSELRGNPPRRFGATATHRQGRTFLPPAEFAHSARLKRRLPDRNHEPATNRRLRNRFPHAAGAARARRRRPRRTRSLRARVSAKSVLRRSFGVARRRAVTQIYKLVKGLADRFLSWPRSIRPLVFSREQWRGHGVTLHHPTADLRPPVRPPHFERELNNRARTPEQRPLSRAATLRPSSGSAAHASSPKTISFIAYVPSCALALRDHIVARATCTLTDMRDEEHATSGLLKWSWSPTIDCSTLTPY